MYFVEYSRKFNNLEFRDFINKVFYPDFTNNKIYFLNEEFNINSFDIYCEYSSGEKVINFMENRITISFNYYFRNGEFCFKFYSNYKDKKFIENIIKSYFEFNN